MSNPTDKKSAPSEVSMVAAEFVAMAANYDGVMIIALKGEEPFLHMSDLSPMQRAFLLHFMQVAMHEQFLEDYPPNE